jgi:hypothetical protein
MRVKLSRILEYLGACDDSVEWVRASGLDRFPQTAWLLCERADWLAWIIDTIDDDHYDHLIRVLETFSREAVVGCPLEEQFLRLEFPWTELLLPLLCKEDDYVSWSGHDGA